MNAISGIKLRWLHDTLGQVTYHLARVRFIPPAPSTWTPAINCFVCDRGLRICIELAGVDRSEVELAVGNDQIVIRGTRAAPEPTEDEGKAVQVLAFEIDYGPFERMIELPAPVSVSCARAEQRNGLLWIDLPFSE